MRQNTFAVTQPITGEFQQHSKFSPQEWFTRCVILFVLPLVLFGCGGSGGSAAGSDGGGVTPPPPPPPVSTTNQLSGDVTINTGANGLYVGNNYITDAGGITEAGSPRFSLYKNQIFEGMMISRSGTDVNYKLNGFKTTLADGEFVEFQIQSNSSGYLFARVNMRGEDGFIADSGQLRNPNTDNGTYRYTHSGVTEDFKVEFESPSGVDDFGILFAHSLPVANANAASAINVKRATPFPAADINWTAVARGVNGTGWDDVVFVGGNEPAPAISFDRKVAVPSTVIANLIGQHGMPLQKGDAAHKNIISDLIVWANNNGDELVDAAPAVFNSYAQALSVNDTEAGAQPYLDTARLDFDTAWQTSTGSGVVVCIADSGADFSHEELVGRLASRANTDDNTDDISGINGTVHGLSVTSVIGALTNNSTGIAGAAHDTTMHFVRIGQTLNFSNSNVLEAIEHCIDVVQPDVINLSLANNEQQSVAGGFPSAINDKIAAFIEAGGFVIQAAGNQSAQLTDTAVTAKPGYVYVAALTGAGNPASYTNLGSAVDVAVFGGGNTGRDSVRVATNGDSYGGVKGTSFSTPLVTSMVALMKEEYPGLTGREFERALHDGLFNNSVDGFDFGAGYLGLNAKQAVDAAVSLRDNPVRLLADAYRMRHSGDEDLIVTIHLDDALTASAQLTTTVDGSTLAFAGLKNITATSFDARFTVPASLSKDFEIAELVFTLPDDELKIAVVHTNARAGGTNSAASYANALKLVGNDGSNTTVVKVLTLDDLDVDNRRKFTLNEVDVDSDVTSVFVAIDTNGNNTFCEAFEYCSASVPITGDVTDAAFNMGQ